MIDLGFGWLVINLAYFITFIALAVRDVLLLRCVLISANTLQVFYQFGFNANANNVGSWNALFLAIMYFKLSN